MNASAMSLGTLVGRYGGDEFLVTIPNQSADAIFEMAEKSRLAVEHNRLEVLSEGHAIQAQATVSIGLATFPNDASEMKDLIEKARQALFRAKEAGGNTSCFYEEKDGLTGVFNRF
jgi:diguanylate cyclase (GGDEF)-like protein